MPKLTPNAQGQFTLPNDFLNRRHIDPQATYWLDERDGDLILHPCRPDVRKLYIEVTTACNLSCQTCIRHSWSDPAAHMSEATFERILADISSFPELERIVFTSFGEPFYHPRFLEYVAAIRQRGLAVTIGSNGLLLSNTVWRRLIELGVDQVIVSIDGVNPQTYADIRGAQLSQVLHNIEQLKTIKKELHAALPNLGIEFVVIRDNLDEVPGLCELASQLNATRTIVSNILPYTLEMYKQKLYDYAPQPPIKTQGRPIRSDAWVRWGVIELPRMHWGAEPRCRFIHDYATVISWDGEVSPCYALSHNYQYYAIDGTLKQVSRLSFGNIHQKSLAEIWMSEEYTHYRSEVRSYHFPSCPDCDLRETCDLRARNEACWGHNPSCADCLWAQDIVRCP
jgi:tungsten cofactor oxidoreducase radical SAM maturase